MVLGMLYEFDDGRIVTIETKDTKTLPLNPTYEEALILKIQREQPSNSPKNEQSEVNSGTG